MRLDEYYRTARLDLPPNYNKRFWRVVDRNGRWRRIGTISNIEKLRTILLRYLPFHVYYSVNCWLNSKDVGPNTFRGRRKGYEIAQNVMIMTGVAIDIDIGLNESLNETIRRTAMARDYVKQFGEPMIKFTGRGFHVWMPNVEIDGEGEIEDPIKRMEVYRKNRMSIVEDLERAGIKLDREVTLNPKQVVRAEGTVNGNNGYICSIIDDIDGFRLDRIKRVEVEGRESRDAMIFHDQIAKNGDGGKRARPKPPPRPLLAVSSRIMGTVDRHVLIFHINLQSRLKILNKIIASESLSNLYIFRERDKFAILCLEALQEGEIIKLLKKWKFYSDMMSYRRFHQNLLYLSDAHLIKTVEGDYKHEIMIGKAFYYWFKSRYPNVKLPRIKGYVGNGILKMGVIELK